MIIDLVITVIIITAGCWLLFQLYDVFKNETVRMLIVVAYGLFVVLMLFYWFYSNLENII